MADRTGRILVAVLALWSTSAGAEVVRIDITSREPMNNGQTARLDDANSLAEPDKLRRVETTKPYTRDMAFELPAYTVAVIEIRAN